MTQLDHCVLATEILGPVLSCRSVHFKMASTTETHEFLVRAFPLEHKKLMFMFMIILMLMLMILMSLVGTKLNPNYRYIAKTNFTGVEVNQLTSKRLRVLLQVIS